MQILEIAREVIPYGFAVVGVYSLYSIADSINENLFAIRRLLLDKRDTDTSDQLIFDMVTCGGCGQTMPTGPDQFTPIAHECNFSYDNT